MGNRQNPALPGFPVFAVLAESNKNHWETSSDCEKMAENAENGVFDHFLTVATS